MEHRMRNTSVLKAVVAFTIVLGFSLTVRAQSEPQKKNNPAPAQQSQQPASKPHKVWTEDNLSTVRTPADSYLEVKERQAAKSSSSDSSVQAVSDKQPAADSAKPGKPAPLSQAKSFEDAENKIAWEKRDIEGQEEYLAKMQERLDQATPDQKEHIQKLIEQHKQIIADTRKELKGLEDQKKDFQKNPAGQSAPAGQQPPSR
jgi:hypothetical protein